MSLFFLIKANLLEEGRVKKFLSDQDRSLVQSIKKNFTVSLFEFHLQKYLFNWIYIYIYMDWLSYTLL